MAFLILMTTDPEIELPVSTLMNLLENDDPDMIKLVILLIERLENKAEPAIPKLTELVNSDDIGVSTAADQALQSIGAAIQAEELELQKTSNKITTHRDNKISRDQAAGKVQSAIALYFVETLVEGKAKWPSQITDDMFDDGKVPLTDFGGYTWSYDVSTHSILTN